MLKSKLLALSNMIEVVDLPATTVLNNLTTDWKDYEDALQYNSALAYEADCIVTRNKKDYEKSLLPVYTADEYISLLNSNY